MKNNLALKLYGQLKPRSKKKQDLQHLFDSALEQLYVVYRPLQLNGSQSVVAYEAVVQTPTQEFSNPIFLVTTALQLKCLRKLGRKIIKVLNHSTNAIPTKKYIFVHHDSRELLMASLYAIGGMAKGRVMGEIELLKKFPPNKVRALTMVRDKNRMSISEYMEKLAQVI